MEEIQNIALLLSYDGTRYHGWQSQKNADTIQDQMISAIERTLGKRVTLSGCSRTDAGVHARRYVANFKAPCSIPDEKLPFALGARLPDDIAVLAAKRVPESFDSRFSCVKKEYEYVIYNGRIKDPLLINRAHFYPVPLSLEAMQRAAGHFVGKKDFAAVRSVGTPVKSTVRTIFYCEVSKNGPLFTIRVCADGFLYNMVRAIAGTLIYAGSGKIEPDAVEGILLSKDREQAGPTAPACGLYLTKIWHDVPVFEGLF